MCVGHQCVFSPSQSLVCFSSTQGCPWQRQHHLCCYWNIPCIRVQRYSRIWLSALIFWPQYVLSLFLTPLTRSQWAMSRREKSKRNAKNKCFGAQLVLERDPRKCDLFPILPHMDHCRWYHGSLQGTTERRFIGSIKKAVNVFGYSCRICSWWDKLYLMMVCICYLWCVSFTSALHNDAKHLKDQGNIPLPRSKSWTWQGGSYMPLIDYIFINPLYHIKLSLCNIAKVICYQQAIDATQSCKEWQVSIIK